MWNYNYLWSDSKSLNDSVTDLLRTSQINGSNGGGGGLHFWIVWQPNDFIRRRRRGVTFSAGGGRI